LRRGAVGAVSPALHAHYVARSKIESRARSFRSQRVRWIHPSGRRVVFLFFRGLPPGTWAGPASARRSCPVSRKTWSLARSARSKRIPLWSCACKPEGRLDTSVCAGGGIALTTFRRQTVDGPGTRSGKTADRRRRLDSRHRFTQEIRCSGSGNSFIPFTLSRLATDAIFRARQSDASQRKFQRRKHRLVRRDSPQLYSPRFHGYAAESFP